VRKQKTIVTVILIFILLCSGGAAAYYVIDNSPKVAFLKAQLNNFNTYKEAVDNAFGKDLAFYKKGENTPYKVNNEVSFDMNFKGSDPEIAEFQPLSDFFKEFKLTGTHQVDRQKKQLVGDLQIDHDKTSILAADYMVDQYDVGVQLKDIYDSYLMIDGKGFGSFVKKFDPSYVGPMEINFFDYFYPTIMEVSASEPENKLHKKYQKLVLDSMKKEQFSSEKIVVNNVKGKKLTWKLTEAEVKDLLTKIMQTAEKDEQLQELILNQALRNPVIAADKGLTEELRKDFNTEFKKLLADAIKDVNKAKFKQGFTWSIVVDSKDQVLEENWNLEVEETNMYFKHDRSTQNAEWKFGVESIEGIKGQDLTIVDRYNNDDSKTTKHQISINANDPIEPLELNIDYTHNADDTKISDEIVLSVPLEDDMENTELTVKFLLDRDYGQQDKQKNNITVQIDIDDMMSDSALQMIINSKQTTEFVPGIIFNQPTNKVELTELDQIEIEELSYELLDSLARYYTPIVESYGDRLEALAPFFE
jgi:hypothetical protein